MSKILVALSILALVGCGSDGGSGGGNNSPPPPPPPPPPVVDQYDALVASAAGSFAGEVDTWAEYQHDTSRVVFQTQALGVVSVVVLDNGNGFHGTYTVTGQSYAVWFWPAQDHLSITSSSSPSSGASWTITLVQSDG